MFDLQFMHVVRPARLPTPIMRAQGKGVTIAMSAMVSKEPHAVYPSSSAIRRALDGYVELYADRHARDGVRMNTVSPGLVGDLDWSRKQLDGVTMRRPIAPEEPARVVAFLLSDEAAYIADQNILVDGGFDRGV